MLRSALFAAALFIPPTAMADKIINADGDSFIEVASQADAAPSIIYALNPVSPAQAETTAAQPFQARSAADIPQMQDPSSDVDAMMKADYTYESFR